MSIRDRIDAFWSGDTPRVIPYTVYDWEWTHFAEDPTWPGMFANGLGVTFHFTTVSDHWEGVIYSYEETTQNGKRIGRETLKWGHRELWQTWEDGWHRDYLLKTREDYRVMSEIVRKTRIEPRYEAYVAQANALEHWGIPLVNIGRTPLQRMLVDFAGLENFSIHLMDFEAEVEALYQALLDVFRKTVEMVAEGPGRYVAVLENFTAESLGPVKYGKFLMPVYDECFPILRSNGKIVGCHYDGRTASCAEQIARAPFDLIESLTEPPEGDLPLDVCRVLWPEKLFWCNVQVSDYQLPVDALKVRVQDLARRGSVEGARLAFEVSEHLPVNWRQSMPVVLEALNELD